MQELKSGSMLQSGKYRIDKMLGQGGFGITYQAMMKGSVSGNLGGMSVNVPVAIKEFFIKELCLRDPESSYVSVPSTGSREQTEKYRQKFIKEARNIAALSHPNIVQVVDVFEENGTVYYVMQFLQGGSLRDLIKRDGPLPEDQAVGYTLQIADALGYMHKKKHLCHYDVKPGNILLDGEGKALLIDFGISKNYDEHGNETSNTPVGLSQGYAPLEQYQNSLHDFSPVSDIYSLGATLYTLLTGELPPEAAIVNEDGLGDCPQTISPRTWTAIVAAMQPRRKDRPQTMEEFVALLMGPAPAVSEEEGTVLVGAAPVVDDQKTQLVQPGAAGQPVPPAASAQPQPPFSQGAVPPMPQPAAQRPPFAQPTPQPASSGVNYHPREEMTPEYEDDDEGSGILKYILIALACAALVIGGYFLFSSIGSSDTDDEEEEAKTEQAEKKAEDVVDKEVTVTVLGKEVTFTYSGPVVDNLPEGEGKGSYQLDGGLTAEYTGPYTGGLRSGDGAVYKISNGDVFEGSFDSDFYKNGKYTLGMDGSYFQGDFQQGVMYNGQWFSKNGQPISKVVDGKEQ